MLNLFKKLTLMALLGIGACGGQENPWATVRTPSTGPAQAIGAYTNGCLTGAQAMPVDGPGFSVMRPSRGRFYGHPALIHYLQSLAQEIAAQHGFLLVGDMAQPRGGPLLSAHASHQIGLEADLWYGYPAGAETTPLTPQQREETSASSLVLADGSAVDPVRWNSYDIALLRTAANHPDVERIFVNPAIKQALCASEKGSAWLHKIRPWWGHADHFHVRLKCPAGEASCVSQGDTLPAGDGCDATLAWWFTEEAKASPVKAATSAPVMPASCQALLQPKS